jgi:HSP20 family protein
LDQKDVQVELANGVLAIAGEKKDGNRGERDRVFSERRYGGFERCIPVEDVDRL